MARQSISDKLHNTLLSLDGSHSNIDIFYSRTPVHSKCYIWIKEDVIKYALIGSANFSTNGLTTPFREVLTQVSQSSFTVLDDYLNQVLNNSVHCSDPSVAIAPTVSYPPSVATDSNIGGGSQSINVCDMALYDRYNTVPTASGLNWGHGSGNVSVDDAYIPIRMNHIRHFPDLFPPKQNAPITTTGGRQQRHNDSIEMIWDDGEVMEGLLEGSQDMDGNKYPKNLSSSPQKSILGSYFRRRLGLTSNTLITMDHLNSYGRNYVSVSLLPNGTYYMNFSV